MDDNNGLFSDLSALTEAFNSFPQYDISGVPDSETLAGQLETKIADALREQQVSVPGVEAALREQIAQMQRELDEVKKQTAAQEQIAKTLEQEAADRARDDKKYFWLGALVSLVISLIVEYGSELIAALQQLFLR